MTHSFDSFNWDTPQQVTLSAAPDAKPDGKGATFRVSTDNIGNVREIFAFVEM